MEYYTEVNARTIDGWVKNGWTWGIPISHEAYVQAQNGEWDVVLTAVKPVPKSWFPLPLQGKAVLGLAAGGGQQMPVFAAQGVRCTVLDYSDMQLANERLVAEREGYAIDIIKADMTRRLPFADACFDLVFHPVSNCYVEDVFHVWNECYRVLKPGGVLLAGMDNGVNFLFEDIYKGPLTVVNRLPFNPLKDRRLYEKLDKDADGIQFSHTLEEQIGGQLQAGFTLTALYEDSDKDGLLREFNIPQYIATRA
ncbi:MAG: class I SAM-dependent methyltransferase, partial [Treponema sp.]|nr:class I SAM-dependent methyltransferase [Treponema sp.]